LATASDIHEAFGPRLPGLRSRCIVTPHCNQIRNPAILRESSDYAAASAQQGFGYNDA
jgi:hypothetical protein